MNGVYALKEVTLAQYRSEAQRLLKYFADATITHVGRNNNKHADCLATLASKLRRFGRNPGGEEDIGRINMAFTMQRHWNRRLADSDHSRSQQLAFSREGQSQNPTELLYASRPMPFYGWGLDIIGKINPPSSKQHEYIITATEYFTKWVEAIPLRGTTGATIAAFIEEYIICRFGVPKHIMTDNGTPFANKQVRELLEEYGIKQVFSIIYYPQGNIQAESTNKILIRILSRKIHDNPREWHEQLPMALWAYRTSPRSFIGVSPYSLVYGADAILPAEIKIPSARIAAASGVHWNEVEASNSRIAELDTLDSRRSKEEERTQVYRNRISRAYDKTVKPRVFKVGDLVLETSKHIQQDIMFEKKVDNKEAWLRRVHPADCSPLRASSSA
ncbi:uncharacterized protein K02A2.6-like [Papaver somniferum]|uniref:uncharacterized protein K02A2.6-like n=1 Tax=Papaver somniferum TaxID=3469 RepID=UPI000E701D4F|nr:uncharacterized protein K02A2.6-like [Papaver somniferum]